MIKSGKTPLLRARNIEKKIGIKRIFIKLEGTNPSGSISDRFVEKEVYSALAQGYQKILAEGSKQYLESMLYNASLKNIKVIAIKATNKKNNNLFNENDLLSLKPPYTNEDILALAIANHAYCAIEENLHYGLAVDAASNITNEITTKVKGEIDTVFFESKHDAFAQGLFNNLLNGYITHSYKIPSFYSPIKSKSQKGIQNQFFLEVNKEEMNDAYRLLTKLEYLKLEKEDVTSFALFLKAKEKGLIDEGNHIIILNSAKTLTNIKRIENFEAYSKEELARFVDAYLGQYSDPILDATEAIENAMEKGFIVLATRENTVEGICIVVNMGFDRFIPTYHLAYLGTNPQSKGRGLGTELIEYAVDLTDGKLSLHVDLDNNGAKKLYEKMGFVHRYNRMIYHDDKE